MTHFKYGYYQRNHLLPQHRKHSMGYFCIAPLKAIPKLNDFCYRIKTANHLFLSGQQLIFIKQIWTLILSAQFFLLWQANLYYGNSSRILEILKKRNFTKNWCQNFLHWCTKINKTKNIDLLIYILKLTLMLNKRGSC